MLQCDYVFSTTVVFQIEKISNATQPGSILAYKTIKTLHNM